MKKSVLIRILLITQYICILPLLFWGELGFYQKIYFIFLLFSGTISGIYLLKKRNIEKKN